MMPFYPPDAIEKHAIAKAAYQIEHAKYVADKKAAGEKYKQAQKQRELEHESDWANEVMAMSDAERLAVH